MKMQYLLTDEIASQKISQLEVITKCEIEKEIKQTNYKGYKPEGIKLIAEAVENELLNFYPQPINWGSSARIFSYGYIYDIAFNRGIRHERKRKAKKKASAINMLTVNDIKAIAKGLNISLKNWVV